jgi:hypothetical protein
VTEPASPAEALRRRLREDPGTARGLDALRRAAYGRADGDASHVEVPEGIRLASGIEDDVLPAPLVALLVEEERLVAEGRDLLVADARAAAEAAPPSRPAAATPVADDIPSAAVETADPRARPLAPRRRRILRPGPVAAVLAGALLLAGLGTASASGLLTDDDSWRSQRPTSTPGPPSTPDPRVGMPVPRFTEEPPAQLTEQLTEAQTREALRSDADVQWMSLTATDPGLVRPDVTTERIMPSAEWLPQHAACLREAGVAVTLIGTGDDQRLSDVTVDPVVAYACSVRFPQAPTGALTRAALAYYYGYSVSFLIPCYASAGEPYRGRIPSLEEHIARSRAGDPWFPQPARAVGDVVARCPQDPPLAP